MPNMDNKNINKDWQDAAKKAIASRDRLRVRFAEMEEEITLLRRKIDALERCVIQNALNTSRLTQREEVEADEQMISHAGRLQQNEIDDERHNDETE